MRILRYFEIFMGYVQDIYWIEFRIYHNIVNMMVWLVSTAIVIKILSFHKVLL